MAASSAGDQATGIAITFDSGFFAMITDVNWSGISRGAIETTHSGTTPTDGSVWRTFQPSDLIDAGELQVTLQFEKNTTPPYDGSAETCTVTFPTAPGESSAATWSATAFMTDFSFSAPPLDDSVMEATCTLKFTGAITITPAT